MRTDDNSAITPALELDSVTRTFGPTEVLHTTNLAIFPGEFVAIVGPSGSGKSTLLNIIGLLDQPSSGILRINGIDTASLRERDKNWLRSTTFGFVFQASNLLPNESAVNNAALGMQIQGSSLTAQRNRITSLFTTFGLMHRSGVEAKLLSGGERQRLALARAIAAFPALVLADEPTGNLDSSNSQLVIDDLKRLNATGTTIVVITHDPSVAAAAKRVITISDGTLQETGTSAAVPTVQPPIRTAAPQSNTAAGIRKAGYVLCSALSTLTTRPLVSLLLVLAFVLGTGGLSTPVGLSESAAVQVSDRLTKAALDQIIFSVAGAEDSKLDAGEIHRRVTGLKGVKAAGLKVDVSTSDSPVTRYSPGTVEGDTGISGPIIGAGSDLFTVYEAQTTPLNAPTLLDVEAFSRSAILGRSAADRLGIQTAGPGAKIWICGEAVDVIGIINDVGRQEDIAGAVFLPASFASTLPQATSSWIVRTEPGYPAPLAEAIPAALAPGNPAAVSTQTVADLRSLRVGVSNDLGIFVGAVSIVLLVLASLSAGTSMYLSVHSRRTEVAMRRAIGQSRGSIRLLFILEGLLVGILGGAAGAALGTIALVTVCSALSWTPVQNISSVFVAVAVGAATGIISASYPAFMAARANPAQAIRG